MSNDSKHTPGPWFADLGEAYRVRAVNGANLANGTHLTLRGRRGADEVASNVRLMAAAPEMYEALKLCASYLGEIDTTSEDWGDPEAAEAYRAARKAIAKAEDR